MPSGNPGKVLDFGGERKLAADLVALDHERLEARSRGINRGRVAGAAGTDDHNVMHELISETIRLALIMPLSTFAISA